MKEIDNIVKKVLLESLNEKADEITNKIHSKLSGDMKEGECMEGDCGEMKEIGFKKGLVNAARKKFGKTPKSLEDKFGLSDFEDDDMTDITSGEFDYVAERECMEGNCGEMEESMVPGEGEERMRNYRRGALEKLLGFHPDDPHLKKELGIEDEDGEMKEGNAFLKKLKDTPKGKKFKLGGKTFTDTSDYDGEMEEGNAFTGALAKAKKEGDDSFEVDGKEFEVQKESYKYSIQFDGEELVLTENELITMIEEIIIEEKKTNLKSSGKSKGMVEFDRVHKKDEDINEKANQESFKKMRDYVKAGSKGNFEENPKNFPMGNGELGEMSKKAYIPSDAVEEYISDFAYPGQTNLTFDEIKPDDDKIEKYLKGDSTTGNSQEYANAVPSKTGEKFFKNYKDNSYGAEQKEASYKRVTAPVDVAGENKGAKSYKTKGQKALDKLSESMENEKILTEEMVKMKNMMGYNKKTQ